MPHPTVHQAELADALQRLMQEARDLGFTFKIDTEPGGLMVGEIRPYAQAYEVQEKPVPQPDAASTSTATRKYLIEVATNAMRSLGDTRQIDPSAIRNWPGYHNFAAAVVHELLKELKL